MATSRSWSPARCAAALFSRVGRACGAAPKTQKTPTHSRARAAQDENGILRTEVRTAFAGTHTIEWVSETKVELTDKNNQAVILACCCPGCVQNFSARHPARA